MTSDDEMAAPTAPALTCVGLTAGYGKVVVARNIDLEVHSGKIAAILGPNGAGKSTLLLTLAGFLKPLAGKIDIAGLPQRGGSARRMSKAGVVLVPDSRALFTQLTALENLKLAARDGGAVAEVLELFPGLEARQGLRAGQLSGGEQQMLAVARALVQSPKVLLIDELSMGLAPVVVEALLPSIRSVADTRCTAVVIVEQHVHLALELADQALVLVHGDVVASGTTDQVRRQSEALESAYLGQSTTR